MNMHAIFLLAGIVVATLGWTVRSIGASEDGLIGWWAFGESDGRVVPDKSGRGNEGIVEDAALRPEKGTQSLELDG